MGSGMNDNHSMNTGMSDNNSSMFSMGGMSSSNGTLFVIFLKRITMIMLNLFVLTFH